MTKPMSRDPDLRLAMTQRAGGRRSVPQIFIGGQHVGGCDDLHALESQASWTACWRHERPADRRAGAAVRLWTIRRATCPSPAT